MSRLIDAELIEKEEGWLDGTCLVIPKQIIYDAPTVKAEPIRHGHWVRGNYIDIKDSSGYRCSECGEEFDKEIFELYTDTINYCPACGSKMDEKK